MKKTISIFFVGLLLLSCIIEPEKINFGSDACHFCKMTIVDKQHAAQYVTSKGKQFKFDAIECMLNEFSEKTTNDVKIILVADFGIPETMTDARTATYLISEQIKSPMGAFLSGFSDEMKANEFVLGEDDRLFTWSSIKEKYSVK